MKIETTASGKVFFSGEYMALEGGRAITLSTPQSAKVSISESNEPDNLFFSSMSDQIYPFRIDKNMRLIWLEDDPKHLGSILEESIKQFEKGFSGKHVSIDTSEFYYEQRKIGIGSSSAVSVAITKAFNQLFHLRLASKTIINHAREIHNRYQDSCGSGFDIITAFMDVRSLVCRIHANGEYSYEEIDLPETIRIIVVVNNEYVQTSEMITSYEASKSKYKDYFSQHAPKMKNELELLYKSILKSDNESIFRHLTAYNESLVDMSNIFNLGVFNNHQELIKFAKNEGVFYKPSGSGGGDIGIIICDDKLKLDSICEKLSMKDIKFFEI